MSSKKPTVECNGWCYTEAEEDVVYDYAWTIEKFSRAADNYKTGKTMYSDQFSVVVHGRPTKWRLKMYPNGRKEVDKGYVTLFLKDSGRDQPANLRANVKFSVVDSVGNLTNTKTIDKEYKVLNHAFGYSKFIKHQALFERGLLPDDKLTLLCRLTVQGGSLVSSGAVRPQVKEEGRSNMSSLGSDLACLLASPEEMGADLRLMCGVDGVEIKCHTNILAARSPVFRAMFQHDTAELRNKMVTVPDLEPDVVKDMLYYIYTGEVKWSTGCEEELLAAADKYGLLELKSMCETVLCRETTVDNVLQRLVLADRHNADKLKTVSTSLLISNSESIVKQEGWRKVLQPYPDLLAEMFEVLATSPPSKRRRVE